MQTQHAGPGLHEVYEGPGRTGGAGGGPIRPCPALRPGERRALAQTGALMTVMDLLRSARDTAKDPLGSSGRRQPAPGMRREVLLGAVTALGSAAVVLLLALLVWVGTSRSTVGIGAALGVGADTWLLGHGARLGLGQGDLALTPLAGWVMVVAAVAYGARRVARSVGTEGPLAAGLVPRDLAKALGGFAGGYVVAAAGVGLLTLAAPVRPALLTVLPALLVTVLAGCAYALAREAAANDERSWWGALRVPATLRRAARPAVRGAAAMLAVGAVLVLALVVLAAGRVQHVGAELAPGFVGGLVLWSAQLLYLPNLALWAVSFTAGSGFQVVAGAPTTWHGAEAGLMPMVPVFAALPSPGPFPWLVRAVVLLPLVVGVLIGRWSLQSVARLSRLRTKAAVAATAAVVAALLLGAADVFAGGALGGYRLSDLGAPALSMTGLLAAELLLGALAMVVFDVWRLRRRSA